jgi:phosphomethylpyrimidine synthase
MRTQLASARDGILTPAVLRVAEAEGVDPRQVCTEVAAGRVVILANPRHAPSRPAGVGRGLRVKVNVNLGTSPDRDRLEAELDKLALAHRLEADAVMDLSTGADLGGARRELLARSELPLGTVPAYEAFARARRERGGFAELEAEDLFRVIREQAADGVDFMTVHVGVTRRSLACLERQPRALGITSRGGSLLAAWMRRRDRENPLYERFDELVDIAAAHDVALSLGDALRPGCIDDATDRPQVEELIILGELARRARARGVQVMIEGPGHVPLHQVAANVELEKALCEGAPFYVLGPVVCDVAPGFDHVTAAIGGAIAALAGADFLCFVTPAEHVRLPTLLDVEEGIVATKIAALSADLARGRPYAVERNRAMAAARRSLDWERMFALALDPARARALRSSDPPRADAETCTMCGDFCAIRLGECPTNRVPAASGAR